MRNLPVNKTGYLKGAKTAKNPVNIIPSSLITTQGMAFPIKANGKTLYPNTGQYKFPTPYVVETPLKQEGSDELKASEAAKFTYRIKDKKRRDTQVRDMYNNTLDAFRGDTTNAKRMFKSFFKSYGSERFNDVKPLEGYYGFDMKDYDDKTLDSLGKDWHKQMRAPKKQEGTKNAKAFNLAFAKARKAGEKTFTLNGKSFTTDIKEEPKKDKPKVDYNDGRKFNLSEGLRRRIYNSVNPDEYPLIEAIPALGRFTSGRRVTDEESANVTQADKDAWAFYMGVPQKEKTVTRSEYSPTKTKNKTKTNYYTVRNAYPAFEDSVVSNASKAFAREKSFWQKASDKIYGNKDTKDKRTGVESSFRPLQNVTYSRGKDKKGHYYSLYDTYDFDVPFSDKVGNPYEIYDRVYYDSTTGKPLSVKKQGSKDMKPLIKYQQGALSISAKNKKQFQDVANNKKQTVKKEFSEPFIFGQKPGSIGEKIGQVLTLGNKSYPGQGYSITPSEVAKQTAIDLAAGKILGLAAKTPAAKKVGEYITTKTPLKNLYKLNPFSVKENPNVLLHRVQKPGQTEEYIMEQFNKPNPRELLKSNEPGWGRAFSSDPSDMYYYTNPRVMQTRGYSGNPEILRTVMPKKDITKFDIEAYNASRSSEGLPLYGSSKPKSEFILPIEDVINAKKFGIDDLDRLVKENHKFNTPHWLKGFKKQGSKNVKSVLKYKNGSKSISLAFSRGEKDPKGGLTQKGVDKYNRATGGNLKMAVTTPPSKLKPGSKAANRRKSFCARMSGVKGPMAKNGKPTRKALALRKWNC